MPPAVPPDDIEISYTVRHDLSPDSVCGMTGVCDCTITWTGGGKVDRARSTAEAWRFRGTWRRTAGDCHGSLELWTPTDGLAWHTLWIGNDGVVTGWVAHARPEQGDPLSSGMKEAGQVYVTGLEVAFQDGAVQHEEVSEGAAGPLHIRSVHQLSVRLGKGKVAPVAPAVAPVIAPPAGPSSTFGWTAHVDPDPAAGPCEVTAVCRCTVRGSFVGVAVPQPQLPVGSRAFAGTWTVLSSTCPDTEPSARIGRESPVALFVTPEPGGAVAVTASSEPRDPEGEVPSFVVTGRPSSAGLLAASTTESRGAVGADGAFRLVRVEVRRTIDLGKELGP